MLNEHVHILNSRHGAPTARRLAQYIGCTSGYNYATEPQHLIRWGSSKRLARRIPSTTNFAAGIEAASHKGTSHAKFTAAHIPTPEIYGAVTEIPSGVPILGRSFTGQRGAGITPYVDRSHVHRSPHDFFTMQIEKSAEYRVHTIKGRPAKIQRKAAIDGADSDPIIWSHDRGYEFLNVTRAAAPPYASSLAAAALAVLNLDFGAVDIIEDADGQPYVLEVNTAPALAPSTLDIYARKLAGIIGLSPEDLAGPEAVEWPEHHPEEELETA